MNTRILPRIGLGLVVWGLLACSPTYNWRELRIPDTPLEVLMPCKPDVAQRPVPLGGQPAMLNMQSCETGGITFAVAWVDVGEEVHAAAAQALLRKASLAAVRVDPARAEDIQLQWTPTLAGVKSARGLQVEGQTLDQKTVRMKVVHFASGQQVFQAAVYGSTLPDEPSTTFFEGLRLP